MIYRQLFPKKAWHSNRIFTGKPPVQDCPATVYNLEGERAVAINYKASLLQRLFFLFNGQIVVSIFGDAVPPHAVGIGNLFERKKPQ